MECWRPTVSTEHARRAMGLLATSRAKDGRSISILHKEEAGRGARPGQWLRGADWSGARCVKEQADGSQSVRQTVGGQKIGSRLTVKISWL